MVCFVKAFVVICRPSKNKNIQTQQKQPIQIPQQIVADKLNNIYIWKKGAPVTRVVRVTIYVLKTMATCICGYVLETGLGGASKGLGSLPNWGLVVVMELGCTGLAL